MELNQLSWVWKRDEGLLVAKEVVVFEKFNGTDMDSRPEKDLVVVGL